MPTWGITTKILWMRGSFLVHNTYFGYHEPSPTCPNESCDCYAMFNWSKPNLSWLMISHFYSAKKIKWFHTFETRYSWRCIHVYFLKRKRKDAYTCMFIEVLDSRSPNPWSLWIFLGLKHCVLFVVGICVCEVR